MSLSFRIPVSVYSRIEYLKGVHELAIARFRPNKSLHLAVMKALGYINEGWQHIVDIDLKTFFDEVDHSYLLQLLYRKIKCPKTLRLIRKWLRAPILINGRLVKRRKGVPQGSPLSPLLSNIMLHELDRELERQGLRFVRYADDCAPRTAPVVGVDAMMMMEEGPPNSVCRN